jgi:transcriptional antiterminator RfaH
VPILKAEADLYPPHLFEQSRAGLTWWVAHSRSRQEKAFARHLHDGGVSYYLPKVEKRRRRAGRQFTSYLPLFTGYVFFGGDLDERRQALQSNLLVSVLQVEDQASLDQELASLWQLQCSGAPLVPHPYLGPGSVVEVIDGPFKGWTGTVLREKGKTRLVVSITFLRQAVAADLPRDLLAPTRVPAPSVSHAHRR